MVGANIAWYLFFIGAGSGAYLIGSCIDFALRFSEHPWLLRASTITDPGLIIGPVLVALSSVFLIFDLGVPEHAFYVYLYPSGSLLSLGSWAILLFVLASCISLVLGYVEINVLGRTLEIVSSIIATVLAGFTLIYSGIYFSMYPSIPFLHTPLLPVLFIISGLTTGMASLLLIGFIRLARNQRPYAIDSLIYLDISFIVIELIILTAFMMFSGFGDQEQLHSALSLLVGPYCILFWIGIVLTGLILPLALDIFTTQQSSAVLLAIGALSTLIGGICLRFGLLMATNRLCLSTMINLVFWQ